MALFVWSAVGSIARADDSTTHIKTGHGTLDIHDAIGTDCADDATLAYQCKVLTLDGKRLVADYRISIDRVFPKDDPVLLAMSSDTGGNRCCWYTYIIDLTHSPPIKMKDIWFGPEISRAKGGVQFRSDAGEDSIGDQVVGTYTYALGSGRPVKVGTASKIFAKPFTDMSTVYDLLNEQSVRGPVLAAIGRERFAQFRKYTSAASPLKKVGDYLVGEGCSAAFDCDEHYGVVVLDTVNKLAWAAEGQKTEGKRPTAQVWGALTPTDSVPLYQIRYWLAEHHTPEGSVTFAALPQAVAQAYRQPRKEVANAESPPSPQPIAVPTAPPTPELALPTAPAGRQVRVPLESQGGTFVVPVTINGRLTLDFTIDSGAADVSIPADVVMTLVRMGTIGDDDFLGKQTYTLADGSTVPSQTFRIRSLKVGDHTLENVVGSVAPVAGGLLLGQSFLSRFGSWSIDNKAKALVLQ